MGVDTKFAKGRGLWQAHSGAGWRLVGRSRWHHRNQWGRPKLVSSPKNLLQGENVCVQWLLRKRKRLGKAIQVRPAGQRRGPVKRAEGSDGGVAKEVSEREGQ